jgi:hypothetical protein
MPITSDAGNNPVAEKERLYSPAFPSKNTVADVDPIAIETVVIADPPLNAEKNCPPEPELLN